jgi:phage tail sheath protein FI
MATTYAYPGVYIEEITGPGVIVGVGTSTAAFIGPAARGPFMQPTVITSFDDFARAFGEVADGWPYLERAGRRFFLGHGVQGFFDNGGSQAVIVRIGSAKIATWSVKDQEPAANAKELFQVQALAEGSAANSYSVMISAPPTPAVLPQLVYVTASVDWIDPNDKTRIRISYPGTDRFLAGDVVSITGVTGAITVVSVQESTTGTFLVLDTALTVAAPQTIRIASIDAARTRFRLAKRSLDIQAGSLIKTGGATAYFSVVDRTDADGFVFLRVPFQSAAGAAIPAASPIDPSTATTVQSLDFGLTVTDGAGNALDTAIGLSLDPFHSGYLFRRTFTSIRVLASQNPPTTTQLSYLQPATGAPTMATTGVDDDPSSITSTNYHDALAKLADVDDVNIVCAPDAANDPVAQKELVTHCKTMADRIAVVDVPFGLSPANSPSALDHEQTVSTSGGFGALYYPWLMIPDPVRPGNPRPLPAQFLAVPPSGHIAGVYARVDETLGVHTPPANTEVLGVIGLERRLSDREQGLINLKGVNAIRIFPGDGRVLVWGARTTAPMVETDWAYVNVRRLLLYIEESIQEGIRWAVFKPNDYGLWQSLKRTIGSFLDRVWKDGGLVGLKAEEAYQVRIDEGLNPKDEIALGRLHIEIKVAPVRPAEFIIVRIGLWDGGAQVAES